MQSTVSRPTADVAIVHLVRRRNGLEHFERFVASHRHHPAGSPHDLVVIFKGLRHDKDMKPYRRVLGEIPFIAVPLPDKDYDIGAYVAAAREIPHRRVCFLNSFSEILADNWLANLLQALETAPNAGAVGATGSWEAPPYSPGFPNPSLRTNAFLMDRELFLQVTGDREWTRQACLDFEAGTNSLTRELAKRDYEPYVVDREGRTFAASQWRESATFRSGEQRALLVDDNRTRAYRAAGRFERIRLEFLAWHGLDLKCYQPKRLTAWRRWRQRLPWVRRRCRYGEPLN